MGLLLSKIGIFHVDGTNNAQQIKLTVSRDSSLAPCRAVGDLQMFEVSYGAVDSTALVRLNSTNFMAVPIL